MNTLKTSSGDEAGEGERERKYVSSVACETIRPQIFAILSIK